MNNLEQTEAKLRRWRDEGSHYKTYQVADDLISECRELRAELTRVKAEMDALGVKNRYWKRLGIDACVAAGVSDTTMLLDSIKADKAELARVKSESLRVVPVGEPMEYAEWWDKKPTQTFMLDGSIYIEQALDVFCLWDRFDPTGGASITKDDVVELNSNAIVRPVDLVRWPV